MTKLRYFLFAWFLVAGFAIGASVVGPMLQLSATDESLFPTAREGALLYGTDAGRVYVGLSDGGWTTVSSASTNYWIDGGNGYIYTPTQLRNADAGPVFTSAGMARFTGNSSTTVIELSGGGRLDFGSGANDYLVGDGTGVTTPTYVKSTRAAPSSTAGSGYGFASYSYKIETNSVYNYEMSDFTAATYSGLELTAYSPSNGATRFLMTNGIQGFAPNATQSLLTREVGGAQHPVEQRGHTLTASFGMGTTGCPDIRERIASNGTDVYEGACDGTVGTSTVTAGNYMREISFTTAAAAASEAGWYSTDTSGGFRGFTRMELLPRFCARIRPSITSPVVVRAGLCTDVNCTTGIYWRYDSAAAANNWQYCSNANCTTFTALTISTNPVTLCVDVSAGLGNSVDYWINGAYAAFRATTLPAATDELGPVVRVYTGNGVAKTMTLQALHVESF